jgi:hypothetical protein
MTLNIPLDDFLSGGSGGQGVGVVPFPHEIGEGDDEMMRELEN